MSFADSRCAHEIFYNPYNFLDPLAFLQALELGVTSFLENVFQSNDMKKFQLHLKLGFIKRTSFDEDDVYKIIYIATDYTLLRWYGDIPIKVKEAFSDLLQRFELGLEDLELEGSGFSLNDIDFLDCHVLRIVNNGTTPK